MRLENITEEQAEGYLATKQAARYIDYHPESLRRLVRQGSIKAYRAGGQNILRFRRSDLDEFMQQTSFD